jgi:hypothetical protein
LRAIPITYRLVYYDEVIAKKIIWDDDGNVVLASAYGQYAAGLFEQGCHHRMKRLRSKVTGLY